jgi:ankyrin repeat protein
LNIRDSNNCTPLHLAVAQGDRDVVSLLIDEGADVTLPFTIAPVIEDPYATFASTNKTLSKVAFESRTYTSMALARNPNVKSVLISKLAKILLRRRLSLEDEKIVAMEESGSAQLPRESSERLDNPELELLSYIAGSDGQKLNFSRPLLSWAVLVASLKTVKQIVTSMKINVNEKVRVIISIFCSLSFILLNCFLMPLSPPGQRGSHRAA